MKVYYDKDANLEIIKEKKITIIGYGSQGHAHAANLKDSGITNINIALKENSNSIEKAKKAGFDVITIEQAARDSDIIMMATPDEIQAEIYDQFLSTNMKKNSALAFAHGLNIHFELIHPRKDLDVFMIAPKGPGHTVRSEYVKGGGVPSLVSVYQNQSGNALDIALAYGSGLGSGRSGIIETTFKEECETDLFGEQVVLCGGLTELITAGYETLVEAGYAPEMAYFECLHEVKLIVDLLYEGGIANMRYSISNTAEYGDYVSGKRIINDDTRKEMKSVLRDIQSGKFVRDWMLECKVKQPSFKSARRISQNHDIEIVGKKLRDMMPWIKKNKLVDTSKN